MALVEFDVLCLFILEHSRSPKTQIDFGGLEPFVRFFVWIGGGALLMRFGWAIGIGQSAHFSLFNVIMFLAGWVAAFHLTDRIERAITSEVIVPTPC